MANAYEMYQATPNPADYSPVSSAYEAEKLFGKAKTQKVGQYNSTLSTQQVSMAKAVQAYTEAGWKFLNCPFQINYNGEANYTPFVQKLQSCGAQIVYNDSTPGPTLYGALQAENQIRLQPDLDGGLRRLHRGLRPVEHRRVSATTSTCASPTSHSRRPRSFRPCQAVHLHREEERRAYFAARESSRPPPSSSGRPRPRHAGRPSPASA